MRKHRPKAGDPPSALGAPLRSSARTVTEQRPRRMLEEPSEYRANTERTQANTKEMLTARGPEPARGAWRRLTLLATCAGLFDGGHNALTRFTHRDCARLHCGRAGGFHAGAGAEPAWK